MRDSTVSREAWISPPAAHDCAAFRSRKKTALLVAVDGGCRKFSFFIDTFDTLKFMERPRRLAAELRALNAHNELLAAENQHDIEALRARSEEWRQAMEERDAEVCCHNPNMPTLSTLVCSTNRSFELALQGRLDWANMSAPQPIVNHLDPPNDMVSVGQDRQARSPASMLLLTIYTYLSDRLVRWHGCHGNNDMGRWACRCCGRPEHVMVSMSG